MVAAPAFVFGLIIALLTTEASLAERLMIPPMIAAIVFIAALVCFAWDYARHTRTRRVVRQALLEREDVEDDVFAAVFPDVDTTLVTQTRHAVAQFFHVPAAKVHPADKLVDDLHFDALEPSFHSFVVYHVLNARDVHPQRFLFNTGNLNDIGDLAAKIQRVLDAADSAHTADRNVESNLP